MSLRWISFDSLLDIYCHLPWQVSAKGQKVAIPNGAGLIIQLVLWLGQSRAKCPVGQPDTLWLSSVSSQQDSEKELGLISALLMSLDEVEGCDFFESTFHVPFVFWTSFLPQSRVRASGWRASFFFFLDTIKVILVFNHLVCLKPHVGSWQTNTTSLLKPPVRWRLHISISLPIQPYIRSGLSLFSWKHQDTTFSSAHPEPYLSFPNPSLWKRMGVGLCDVQDPCRHLHEVRGRSRLCVVEEVVVPPHCMLSC